MRDRNRRRVARAKSHRASPAELREAQLRVKEIEQEMREVPLNPETRQGEERERRYERVLRIRALREDFEETHPYDKRPHANGLLLTLVMFVSAFLLCACIAGSAYAGVHILTDKPDPVAFMTGFWDKMETQDYSTIHSTYLGPTLRVQKQKEIFVSEARQADIDFGPVTDAVVTNSQVSASTATLTYKMTRNGKVTYSTQITLAIANGSWGVTDLGATLSPTKAGIPAPPTPTVPPPTATPKN